MEYHITRDISVQSLSYHLQRYIFENMSEILINTYKRTENPMYNLLVVLILRHNIARLNNQECMVSLHTNGHIHTFISCTHRSLTEIPNI